MRFGKAFSRFASGAIGLLVSVFCWPKWVAKRTTGWQRVGKGEEAGAENLPAKCVDKPGYQAALQVMDDTSFHEGAMIPVGIHPAESPVAEGVDYALLTSPFVEMPISVEAKSNMLGEDHQKSVRPVNPVKLPAVQSAPLPSSASSNLEEPANKISCGVASDVGGRRSMEDEHFQCAPLGVAQIGLGIFDGHNGVVGAKCAAEKFPGFFAGATGTVQERLLAAFQGCENRLYQMFKAKEITQEGTTGLVVAVAERVLHIANLGDCRAVLSTNGRAEALTKDHKPSDEEEKARITAAGGFVDADGYVNGELGVARALGDFHLSEVKKGDGSGPLIAVPDITTHVLSSDSEFLIVACDGLWDVVSNQRAVQLARESLEKGASAEEAARKLVEEANNLGTHDNVTVGVVTLVPLPLGPRRVQRPRFTNSRLKFKRSSLSDLGSLANEEKKEENLQVVIN